MKFYNNIFFLIIGLMFFSCKPSEEIYFGQQISRDSYRATIQITEYFDSTAIDTLFFEYNNKNDFFPTSVRYSKSNDSNVVFHIYELNEWNLPRKIVCFLNDSIIKTIATVYSTRNYFLIEETVYDGIDIESNKSSHTQYEYNDEDYLVSTYKEYYSKDSAFLNAESEKIISCVKTRVLPAPINRMKGNHIPYEFVELYTRYATSYDLPVNRKRIKESDVKIGELLEKIETNFDSDGFPVYSAKTLRDGSKSQHWFKTDKDGFGQVVKLTEYEDNNYRKLSRSSREIRFYYDDQTMLYGIESLLYSPQKKQFDRQEYYKEFSWIDFGLNNPQNFILMQLGYFNKYFDYEIGDYFVEERRVVKYEQDEIVIDYFKYPFNASGSDRVILQPYKRVTQILEKVKLRNLKHK